MTILSSISSTLDNLPVLDRLQGYWQNQPTQLVLELAVIWVITFIVVRFLRGARGERAIKVLAFPLVIGAIVLILSGGSNQFDRFNLLYHNFLVLAGIALLVVFQPELRRSFLRLGELRLLRFGFEQRDNNVQQVVEAVEFLAKHRIGALLAIERRMSLESYLISGTPLDAHLSKDLITTLFWPGSPLHDLGVVIRGEKLVAASVQFPLADPDLLPRELGSRHRAALGLATEVDAIVIMVSEETGQISLALDGQLTRDINPQELHQTMAKALPRRRWFRFGPVRSATERGDS